MTPPHNRREGDEGKKITLSELLDHGYVKTALRLIFGALCWYWTTVQGDIKAAIKERQLETAQVKEDFRKHETEQAAIVARLTTEIDNLSQATKSLSDKLDDEHAFKRQRASN